MDYNVTPQVRLVTDSSADIDPELARELGITIVPLTVTFDGVAYEDTRLTDDEFWAQVAMGQQPTTSQPPLGAFHAAYQPLVEAGYQVLCITVTSRHSGTYSSAWGAAQSYEGRVEVFDSQSFSWGLGWQVLSAARMAASGAGMQSILAHLEMQRERTSLVILFESVESLRRGGRASKIMPAIDRLVRALDLKLLINSVDGELKLLGVARSRAKGLAKLASETVRHGRMRAIGVVHIHRPAVAQELAERLSRLSGLDLANISIGTTGAVLASHAGDGVVAAIGVCE